MKPHTQMANSASPSAMNFQLTQWSGFRHHCYMSTPIALTDFNKLDSITAHQALLNCCTAEAWVERMCAARPFPSHLELLEQASEYWGKLCEHDYLQAFAGHPKIGDIDSLREKYAATKALAGGEQSGVNSASDAVLHRLSAGNTDYESKFGFIFIVCASGKSAVEMLTLLEARLPNTRSVELQNACAEQEKITALRLRKLIEE